MLFTGLLMSKDEKELTYHQLSIPVNRSKCKPNDPILLIFMEIKLYETRPVLIFLSDHSCLQIMY